ncbi:hypothetical protein NPIL_56121 [Nephila pilipes]|uniref:Uncharacterized protein n=1 Tax=Nephila pilipes TaxID=299642 RepID=A0A8X6TQB8_NEPPI|nr:hypothetical protein NPIL_56121 [Nephila pilipes]
MLIGVVIGQQKFEKHPNIVLVAAVDEKPEMVSLILRILKEEVLRLVNQTDESSDLHFQFFKETVQNAVERILASAAAKISETRRSHT